MLCHAEVEKSDCVQISQQIAVAAKPWIRFHAGILVAASMPIGDGGKTAT